MISKKTIILLITLTLLTSTYILTNSNLFYHPFEDFQGPSYVPVGFNKTDNISTDNEKIFEYSGNGTFWVCVVKNTTHTELQDLINPFQNDPTDVTRTNKDITINKHTTIFQITEQHFETDLSSISQVLNELPTKQEIPTTKIQNINININMAKFQDIWYCPESNLTYISTGLITKEQLPEIEKMTQSIKCHQEQQTWTQEIKTKILNIWKK